jgi:hypothetical protein
MRSGVEAEYAARDLVVDLSADVAGRGRDKRNRGGPSQLSASPVRRTATYVAHLMTTPPEWTRWMAPLSLVGTLWGFLAWLLPAFEPIPRMSVGSIVGPLILLLAGLATAVRQLVSGTLRNSQDVPLRKAPSRVGAFFVALLTLLMILVLTSTYFDLRRRAGPNAVYEWFLIDDCLDRGGCWVYAQNRCEFQDQSACRPQQPTRRPPN